MFANFLLAPRGAVAIAAEATRVAGLLSVIAGAIFWSPVEVALFALTLLGLCLPKYLGLRAGLDAAIGVALLVAAWSSVIDLYTTVAWWDVVVHFALNGLIAAVAFILFEKFSGFRTGVGRTGSRVAVIVLTATFGLAVGVLWEFGEWAGHTLIDEAIFVNYDDTIGDLASGGAGAVLAGVMLAVGARVYADDSGAPAAAPARDGVRAE
ncbi:hypothetical protein [Marisediminicola senii]|uniref:hypothetical protein n=1 Tax=Marisediminicola senii TaxID=2711233 RepID=UPI0013EA0293|nr:hypothetical protein [Marisediminicola senii]